MAKAPTFSTIVAAFASASKLNANNALIVTAFENTVSLDGSTPNTMSGDLDMGSNDILNVGDINVSDLTIDGISVAAQAAAAAASATAAATSETNADSSETAAASSASAASTSETNAATSFDDFDDRYLGAKASDPTLDNDGNALLTGALYFNSTSDTMKVYDGANWSAVVAGVSSVGIADAGSTEITVTGSPVTAAGTINLAIATIAGTKIDFSGGGDLDTAVVSKQAGDATLTSLAAVSGVAGDILYADGTDTWTKLVKGADAEVLTLASGIPSWAAPPVTREDAVATTSGSSHGFTGIAAGANIITFMLDGVSLNGTEELKIQIGDAEGYETSGYTSMVGNEGASSAGPSSGYIINRGSTEPSTWNGAVVFRRIDGNTWVMNGSVENGVSENSSSGIKTLTAELTQIQILDTGSDNFDAGSINIFVQ